MQIRTAVLWFLLVAALISCTGDIGPAGLQGNQGAPGMDGALGMDGAQGPAYVLTEADLLGTWSGEQVTENGSGTAFVFGSGFRTITFDSDGTYTSDIFTDGGGNLSGSFMVLGTSVVVTSPAVGGGAAIMFQLEDVVASPDSLKFIVDLRPVGTGFQTVKTTVYLLARI